MENIETKKSSRVDGLINSMLQVLETVGIPFDGVGDRMKIRIAEAALAVADIKETFKEAKSTNDNHYLTTRKIIEFENKYLEESASPGSYDDIRRHHLILLTTAGYIINSSSLGKQATNNPTRGYSASPAFASLLRSYGTDEWHDNLDDFKKKNIELREMLAHKRQIEQIPVALPSGKTINLTAGEHNELQRDIIYKFLPRFGFGAEILYIGDTTDKYFVLDEDKLNSLNFFKIEHEEMPDVIAFSASRNLLFMIEAVHSYGQMSEIRVEKLKNKLKKCTATLIFVSAFENKKSFRKFSADIAWETEAWISDNPDHMIHFNGYKFLEIHK